MIEPRIYRAAFIPAILAVVLAMFSLESRPPALPQGLAADVVFEGDQALAGVRAVLDAGEDRRAGSAGDRAAGVLVAESFRERGFRVRLDRFERDGRELLNVVGRRAGTSPRQVVVVAARDAGGVPDAAGSAADTAALLEVARVFAGRPSKRSLVLASVDGATLGEVGAARLAGELGDPGLVDGVIVLSGLGMPEAGPASIEPWSNDTTRAGIGLQRTVTESLRQEAGGVREGASPAGQLARLAFPVGIGAQGVLLQGGYDAVRIAGDGDLPIDDDTTIDQVDELGLEQLGRATLRAVTALDQGARPEHGPTTYVTVVSQVMPGWVLALLSLTLLLPPLVAAVDALARARRRREPVASWLTWLAAGAVAFLVGLGLAHALELAGALPDPPAAPVAPDLYPLDLAAGAALGAVAVAIALAWLGLRRLAVRTDPGLRDATAPGAGVAVALVLSATGLLVWAINPFAALLLAPAVHLWLLGTLVDPAPPRRARIAMVVGGLLPPTLLAVYELATLSLDPLGGAWYLLLLVTGGHIGLLGALLGCVLAATLGSIVSIVRREPPAEEPAPSAGALRGPAGYAGPGSLGGTESALPRR